MRVTNRKGATSGQNLKKRLFIVIPLIISLSLSWHAVGNLLSEVEVMSDLLLMIPMIFG
jgi:hypothetical protein